MDYRPLLARHAVPLAHEKDQWDKVGLATGLTPYEGKASYICGVMREFMQAAGLNFKEGYHLGALFLALDATELLGRVVTGARTDENDPQYVGPSKALHRGVRYLKNHGDQHVAALPHNLQHYVELRNFAGHGATFLPPKRYFDPDSTRLLLRRLAYALNTMWEDAGLAASLATVEVHPMWTTVRGKPQPVYVTDIQKLLEANQPGDQLAHDSWR
ncbi:hypothetical protein ACIQPR_49040 [Streptomyces sp. NPDC091280]|uniref:hypothetical protein n=1 Tax=Streptomyces sp. NPDC091280 TaxID=3365984 RepID=UPI003804B9E8